LKRARLYAIKLLHEKVLLDVKVVGVDSTTLEANAAVKSIVRRDTALPRRSVAEGGRIAASCFRSARDPIDSTFELETG
jgi:hypothetical protein